MDLEKTRYHFEETVKGTAQSYEIGLIHKNGQRIETSVINVPILLEDKVVGVYGITSDVTAAKRYVEEIENLSYERALILNSMSEGVIGLDLDGNVNFANPAAAEMMHICPNEMNGQPLEKMMIQMQSEGIPFQGKVHRCFWPCVKEERCRVQNRYSGDRMGPAFLQSFN